MAINEGMGVRSQAHNRPVEQSQQKVVPVTQTKNLLKLTSESRNSYNPLRHLSAQLYSKNYSNMTMIAPKMTERPTLEPQTPRSAPEGRGESVAKPKSETQSPPTKDEVGRQNSPQESVSLTPTPEPVPPGPPTPEPSVGQMPQETRPEPTLPLNVDQPKDGQTSGRTTGLTKQQEDLISKVTKDLLLPAVEKVSPTVKMARVVYEVEREASKVVDAGTRVLVSRYQEHKLDSMLRNHQITIAEYQQLKVETRYNTDRMRFEAYQQIAESGPKIGKTLLDASPLGDLVGAYSVVSETPKKPPTPST